MIPFTYARADSAQDAVRLGAAENTKYLGGGTNLVDLLRETVERPTALVDVTALDSAVEQQPDGGLRIGAATRNTALAEHSAVRHGYPMLSRAIVAGASGQIRNMATVGGNILQRTRCTYFYDVEGSRCNKRTPGEGCDAIDGSNRIHAVLGTSSSCVATHPSDMAVALAALDTTVHVLGPDGTREIAFVDLHREPGERPDEETVLAPGELITAIELPPPLSFASTYRKVRDRASYAFALVSVAAAVDVADDGTVRAARLALGGIATKPWRARAFEDALVGQPAGVESYTAAADAELAAARPLADNEFKIDLAKRTIVSVLAALEGQHS